MRITSLACFPSERFSSLASIVVRLNVYSFSYRTEAITTLNSSPTVSLLPFGHVQRPKSVFVDVEVAYILRLNSVHYSISGSHSLFGMILKLT